MSEYLIAHIGHTTRETEHILWWKPDSRCYTFCINQAGLYTQDEATRICTQLSTCMAIQIAQVTSLTRTTPYYRRSNGTLHRLYDGGEIWVVPNEAQVWAAIKAVRLDLGTIEKPTPISPRKACAIYLQD